jgi:hypothetical protein
MAAVHQGWWFSARLGRSLLSRLGIEVFGSSPGGRDTIRQDIFLFRISDTIWRPF